MSVSDDKEMSDLFGIDFSAFGTADNDTSDTETVKPNILDKIRNSAGASPIFAQPEDLISEEEIDEDPEYLAAVALIAEKAAIAEAAANAMAAEKERIATLDRERAELVAQVQALNEKLFAIESVKREISGATYTKRSEINKTTRELESAERNIAVVRQNIITRKKTTRTVESYARVAENFSWYTGITTPDGKDIKVLPHQWEGIKFLANAGRAILGDAMGLGKTAEAIGGLDLVGSRRAIVITPAEVTSNFLREVKRWAPHRKVVNIQGLTKSERNMVLDMAAHFEPVVVVVNYEAWRKDLSLIERLIDLQFDTLIADEAHSIKGTNTDAFSGVKRIALAHNICPMCGALMTVSEAHYGERACPNDGYVAGRSITAEHLSLSERHMLSRSIKNVWLMTGTPILNAPEDLYPMLYILDPLAFPYKNAYLRDYCILDMYTSRYKFRAGGLDSLVLKLSGKYLARTKKSSGVILPPQDITFHEVEFTDDAYLLQQDLIRQLKEHAQIVLSEDNKMSAIGVLALITRQRQANVWPAGIKVWEYPTDEFGLPDKTQEKILVFDAKDIKESLKIDKVIDLIMEHGVVEGNRIAVFSQFKTALAELEDRITSLGLRVVRYDGDTKSDVKDQIKTNFDRSMGEDVKWDIVLANYKSGGVGLNFTAVTHTIILDEEWNPGKRDQAYGRTDRMGQTEDNFVHVIRLAHTVDTWLANLIAEKEELIGGFDTATVDIQTQMLQAIKDGKI